MAGPDQTKVYKQNSRNSVDYNCTSEKEESCKFIFRIFFLVFQSKSSILLSLWNTYISRDSKLHHYNKKPFWFSYFLWQITTQIRSSILFIKHNWRVRHHHHQQRRSHQVRMSRLGVAQQLTGLRRLLLANPGSFPHFTRYFLLMFRMIKRNMMVEVSDDDKLCNDEIRSHRKAAELTLYQFCW